MLGTFSVTRARTGISATVVMSLAFAFVGCGSEPEVPVNKPGAAPETPSITKSGDEMQKYMDSQKKK